MLDPPGPGTPFVVLGPSCRGHAPIQIGRDVRDHADATEAVESVWFGSGGVGDVAGEQGQAAPPSDDASSAPGEAADVTNSSSTLVAADRATRTSDPSRLPPQAAANTETTAMVIEFRSVIVL